jgi:hypothetical protein
MAPERLRLLDTAGSLSCNGRTRSLHPLHGQHFRLAVSALLCLDHVAVGNEHVGDVALQRRASCWYSGTDKQIIQ